MKIHKHAVLIETHNGFVEVLSFYDPKKKTYGVDVFYEDRLVETSNGFKREPKRDHLISFGYNYIINNEKKSA